ncbi:hypothetical protein [Enterovirga aerilata]|uniref:Uncharacterized protein n=1 Tax=Enterovirga aerilata TaxID=2730920 RepID=A0A849IDU1_9HYPH|nr:hypothetical protein [Enterovirga sp. DB1703]NNM74200.1 hypothetical protein [Enterovirga sp. DB1703]
MTPLEVHLAERGFGPLQASVWARFLDAVLDALEEAVTRVRHPDYWQEHTSKNGALLKPRPGPAEQHRRLPSEEGVTCALAEQLDEYRKTVPPDHILRSLEVVFRSEARISSRRRTGKNSRRIDIKAESQIGREAPFVVFEAKLIVSLKDLSEAYLGEAGLGCFTLPPEPYPAKGVAGMLAYTVGETTEYWLTAVEDAMAAAVPVPRSQTRMRRASEGEVALWSHIDRPLLDNAEPLNVVHLVMQFEAAATKGGTKAIEPKHQDSLPDTSGSPT